MQMPGGPPLGDGFGPATASILVLTLAFAGAIVGVVHGLALVWLGRPGRAYRLIWGARGLETVHPNKRRNEPRMESVAEGKLADGSRILTVNTGSSSIKVTLYRVEGASEVPELSAVAERIGVRDARLRLTNAGGESRGGPLPETVSWAPTELSDHSAALGVVLERMRRMGDDRPPAAVGHRIVHGGSLYREPVEILPEVVAELQKLFPIDPTHMPQAIAAIGAIRSAYPAVPQVACFDTAFHAAMPRVARLFALPRALSEEGNSPLRLPRPLLRVRDERAAQDGPEGGGRPDHNRPSGHRSEHGCRPRR